MRQDSKIKAKLAKKSKKKKLEEGGLFKPNETLSGAAGLAGATGAMIDPLVKETSMAGKGLTGLAKGAAAGAALGPVGAIAGGLIGGVTGLIGANKAKKAEEQAKFERKEIMGLYNTTQGFANAGNQFQHGGKMLSKKLNVVQGGSLNPVSKDAVEVNANNPQATDSVELENAFVDNNEIIDKKDRVFSDSVFLPSGKSVAKEAKRLEKMKSNSSRFKAADKHIEQKLDNLFTYQESTKPKLNKGGIKMPYEKGGFIDPENPKVVKQDNTFLAKKKILPFSTETKMSPDQITNIKGFIRHITPEEKSLEAEKQARFSEAYEYWVDHSNEISYDKAMEIYDKQEQKFKKSFKKGGKMSVNQSTKPKYQDGTESIFKGNLPLASVPMLPTKVDLQGNPLTKVGTPLRQGFTAPATETNPKFDWQNLITQTATFGPNIAAAALQRKLKGPKHPVLETGVKLKRLSPDAQLAAAAQQTRQAQGIISKNTAQGSDLASATGSLLARRLSAQNQIFGDINNANAQIQAQEAQINQGVKARNAERITGFRDNKVQFNNKLQQLSSENIANLSSKILAQGREKNQMKLDRERNVLTAAQFGDSQTMVRLGEKLKVSDPDLYESMKKQGLFKFGGVIRKKLSKKPSKK